MSNTIEKKNVSTLAAMFYIIKKAVKNVLSDKDIDEGKIDNIITNRILTECTEYQNKGGK